MPPRPETASGYVRLSREAGESNLSREGMRADVEQLAARLGLDLVAMHVDDGLSGAVRDRPEFVAWLDDARTGRASHLLAWHVDRMTREGVNVAALILDVVEGKDPETGRVVRPPVRLLDTKGLDSSGDESAFRFRFVIAAEVARAERERMRDRSRAAHRRAQEAGRYMGGTPPFGTRRAPNPDGGGFVLELEPTEAAALREAARLLLDGRSLPEAVRAMNASTTPRRAAEWSRVTVRQALTSAAVDRLLFSPAERAGLRRALAPTAPDARKGGRGPSRLLSRLLRCHSCGSSLVVARRTDGTTVYRCPARGDGRSCTAPVSVSAPAVEAVVEALWLDGWGRLPETVPVRESDELADRVAELDEQLAASWSRIGALRGPDRAALLDSIEETETTRDALASTRASTLVLLRETGRSYADAWHSGTLDDRRASLLRTSGPLTLLPGRRGPHGFAPSRLLDAWRLDPGSTPEDLQT